MLTILETEFTECWNKGELNENKKIFGVQSFLDWVVETYQEKVVVIKKEAFNYVSLSLDTVLINAFHN